MVNSKKNSTHKKSSKKLDVIIKKSNNVIVKKTLKKKINIQEKTFLQKHKKKLAALGLITSIAGITLANRKKIRQFYTDRAVQIVDKQTNVLTDVLTDKLLNTLKIPINNIASVPIKKIDEAKTVFNNVAIENLNKQKEKLKLKEIEKILIKQNKLPENCSYNFRSPGGYCDDQAKYDKLVADYILQELQEIDNLKDVTDDIFDQFLTECGNYNFECTNKVNAKLKRKLTIRLLQEIASKEIN
jgi:hypothetical protein